MSDQQDATDWEATERWDRNYYLHNVQAAAEYHFAAVARQDGHYLEFANGDRLLDFQSQLISDSLGHRHPAVYGEIRKAMDRYGHVFFGLANEYRARAAKLIIEDILGTESWAGRVRILASGGEAVDSCITMARMFTGRRLVLTQEHSFHGLSVGATRLRGYRNNLTMGTSFSETLDVPGLGDSGFIEIPPPEHQHAAVEGALPSLQATEKLIERVGPENIAAIVTEPMFGAAGLPSHPDYLPGIRRLCDRHGILWIDDEVLCGFGRLGRWFGYQRFGDIAPDLMATGKSINGSSLPCGAVIASHAVADFFERGRWWSGSTWDGHPLICASVVGALEWMLREDILERINKRGAYLESRLRELAEKHPCVGRIGGWGLFYAVDLIDGKGEPVVSIDRETDFTGDLSAQPNQIVAAECAARGVFLGGFVPNTIKVGPPFTIEEAEIDHAIEVFGAALTEVDRLYC